MTPCCVCNAEAVTVCNGLGPMSEAYCKECLDKRRYSWSNVVAYLWTLDPREINDEILESLKPTFEYYNKTKEDLFDEILKYQERFEEEMRKLREADGCGSHGPTARS